MIMSRALFLAALLSVMFGLAVLGVASLVGPPLTLYEFSSFVGGVLIMTVVVANFREWGIL
jgi:hypothetical protein